MTKKIGRNEPCYCGSNKKFKNCCEQRTATTSLPASSQTANALKRATALLNEGKIQEAGIICQNILQSDSRNDKALNLYGILAYYAGNPPLAIEAIRKSIAINNNVADSHNNLGEIYRSQGAINLAITHFQRALQINPGHLDTLTNYGNALQELNHHGQSIKMYEHVISINPNHTGALSNIANALQELNRHNEAITVFKKLLSINSNYDWALGGLTYSQMHCCSWQSMNKNIQEIIRRIEHGENAIKPFELLPIINDPALQLKCASIFSDYLYPSKNIHAKISHRQSNKIRIGYLSADFRQHPVSQLLVEVLEKHDKSKFETIGISFGLADESPVRTRIINSFNHWVEAKNLSNQEICALIKDLNIDIIIDLMGYTNNARPAIFSYKPAPIQIAYLGYAGTSGASYIDYILADNTVAPEADQSHYSEEIARLPHSFLPRDTASVVSRDIPSRISQGLPDDAFVFCAFNNHFKINPEIFSIWMNLLRKIPNSILWLSRANPLVKENLWNEAKEFGVTQDRIIFAEWTDHLEDHLARHKLANLFLDTLPYNAHTTASDALWSGLPIVTCAGKTFAGRVSASLLAAAGMSVLVTESINDYEDLAFKLASDPVYLNDITEKLRRNIKNLPVFDTDLYVTNYESILENIYNKFNS